MYGACQEMVSIAEDLGELRSEPGFEAQQGWLTRATPQVITRQNNTDPGDDWKF